MSEQRVRVYALDSINTIKYLDIIDKILFKRYFEVVDRRESGPHELWLLAEGRSKVRRFEGWRWRYMIMCSANGNNRIPFES